MSSSRSSFISGTIFGIVLGAVVGHFGIWSGVQNSPSPIVESFPAKEASLPGMSFDLGKKSETLPYFPEEALQPVDSYPEPEYVPQPEKQSPLANAIAMQTVEVKTVEATKEPAVVEIDTPAEEPQPLDIDDAAPLEVHETKNDVALKKVIEEELTHIPAGQREVWFESLKDMHVDDAQGVIRMWKLIGGPIPGLGADSLIQPPEVVPPPQANTPNSSESTTTDVTKNAIKAAINIVQRNLMMESTAGYMSAHPRLREELIDGKAVIAGVEEEYYFSQGTALFTNRVLDLMIQGPGFFEVKGPAGDTLLTRRGRFSLNEERQLIIVDGDTEYVLQPVVVIPDGARQIRISEDGSVVCKDEDSNLLETNAAVQTVQLLSISKLSYSHNCMFEYTGEKLESSSLAEENRARIIQAQLEWSNVKAVAEKLQLQKLRELLDK